MEIKEGILAGIKEMILPEIEAIKAGQARADVEFAAINKRLDDVNKRLDDVNQHLVDQSRRIDAVREELGARIDETNKRIDAVREELGARIDETNNHIDGTNKRLDRLYEVSVRPDEHAGLAVKVERLEMEFIEFRKRLAA